MLSTPRGGNMATVGDTRYKTWDMTFTDRRGACWALRKISNNGHTYVVEEEWECIAAPPGTLPEPGQTRYKAWDMSYIGRRGAVWTLRKLEVNLSTSQVDEEWECRLPAIEVPDGQAPSHGPAPPPPAGPAPPDTPPPPHILVPEAKRRPPSQQPTGELPGKARRLLVKSDVHSNRFYAHTTETMSQLPELHAPRIKFADQLKELAMAVNTAAAREETASSTGASPRALCAPRASRAGMPAFLPMEDHYTQALEQAVELYACTDPDADEEVMMSAAKEAAWKDTFAEAVRLHRELPQKDWPLGWDKVMAAAAEALQEDQGAQLQVDERNRWKRLVREHGLNRWQLLVMQIQARKKWLEKARLLSYSEKGCPGNLDYEATDIGSHLGRWQWREIAYQW